MYIYIRVRNKFEGAARGRQKLFENPRTKAFVIKRPKIQQVHTLVYHRTRELYDGRQTPCRRLLLTPIYGRNLIVEVQGRPLFKTLSGTRESESEPTHTRFG